MPDSPGHILTDYRLDIVEKTLKEHSGLLTSVDTSVKEIKAEIRRAESDRSIKVANRRWFIGTAIALAASVKTVILYFL